MRRCLARASPIDGPMAALRGCPGAKLPPLRNAGSAPVSHTLTASLAQRAVSEGPAWCIQASQTDEEEEVRAFP